MEIRKKSENTNDILEILRRKEHLSESEARKRIKEIQNGLKSIVNKDGTFQDMENFWEKEMGISITYIIDVLIWKDDK